MTTSTHSTTPGTAHGAPCPAALTVGDTPPRSTLAHRLRPILISAALVALLLGCSGNESEAPRSIDEIHREEGVPVQVRAVEPGPFRTYLSFTASLTGGSESTATATLSDAVADVLYRVGDYVERDSAVVLFPTDNPSLNYEQARVGFEAARTAFERVERLYEGDGISQQSYDDARTQLDLARANWNSVQNVARVRAPISGYLTRLNVVPSDNVRPGDELFTISEFGTLRTTVWVTDRQVGAIAPGMPARARWQDVVVPGEVVQVDMAMDDTMKAFATRLTFRNADLALRSGVTATVEIETYRNDAAIILNQRDIIESSDGPTVLVARDDTAVAVPVEIDHRQGLLVEIAAGLAPGDEVIIGGADLVADGTTIRIVERAERLVQR
jgi:RND family efflux transporter MFP subunit